MVVYTMLSQQEFDELCVTRLHTVKLLIAKLCDNILFTIPDTYEKHTVDLGSILTQLHRIKIDMESAVTSKGVSQ